MKIKCAYRYELDPNVGQTIVFAKHAGTARFTFNWGLQLRIESYESEKTTTNAMEQHRLLNSLKAESFPWMYEVSKCAPQEALRDLDRAFQNFFRGIKQGKTVGFPKFKKKGLHDSFRLTGTIKIEGKAIQLPRIGRVKLKEIARVPAKILSATVSREADRWYVSVTVEEERAAPQPVVGDSVGIDVGLASFATLSTGEKLAAPKPLAQQLKKLSRASKKHSRKLKGSKNRKKSALKLARRHRKIRNVRKDFLHKLSTNLAKTKSEILLEDLDVKGMLQKKELSRGISDVGWHEFRRMLAYKTEWYGSTLTVVPRTFPSSKRCSACGVVVKTLPLSVRKWRCMACQTEHDRDINAAKNLLIYSTGSSPGIYACGATSDGTGRWPVSHVALKQELMNETFVHKL